MRTDLDLCGLEFGRGNDEVLFKRFGTLATRAQSRVKLCYQAGLCLLCSVLILGADLCGRIELCKQYTRRAIALAARTSRLRPR